MIKVGRCDPKLFISQYMFSVISSGDIRYQVTWRQYINMEGKVTGIGGFELRKSSFLEDRIRRIRVNYLRRIRGSE